MADQAQNECRFVPLAVACEIVNAVFGMRLSREDQEEVLRQVQMESLHWSEASARAGQGAVDTTGAIGQTGYGSRATTANSVAAEQQQFHESFGYSRDSFFGENTMLADTDAWALGAANDGRSTAGASMATQTSNQMLVVEESTFLMLLLLAYTRHRNVYRVGLKDIFEVADGDGDGEIDKGDFCQVMKLAVPHWTVGQAKDMFWRLTGAGRYEVLTYEDIVVASDRHGFFNQKLLIPRFNSEVEVLSPTELECVHTAVANHRAYLDAGFVRKVTAMWQKVYKAVGAADRESKAPGERLWVLDSSTTMHDESARPLSSIPADRSASSKFVTLSGRPVPLARPSTVM